MTYHARERTLGQHAHSGERVTSGSGQIHGSLDLAALDAELIRDEEVRLRPYADIKGILTIGIGHNLSRGLTRAQVQMIYEDDRNEVVTSLARSLPWWSALDGVRKRVLANMGFQLGVHELLVGFKPTLDLVANGDYAAAARHIRGALAYRQTPARWERHARMMETGAA